VYALRFLPRGGRLVFAGTVSGDANLHVHEVETGKEVRPPVGHLAAVTCVALAPAGQGVASGGGDHSVRLWDLKTVEERHALGAPGVGGVGYHPDGKRVLFYGSGSGVLSFADADSGKPRTPGYNQQHGGAVASAAVTRDGRYAVTGGWSDGTVRLWRLQDGRQVRLFNLGSNQGPVFVSVAPDMRRAIATGGTRTRLLQLRCQEIKHDWPPVAWAPFLPDGRAVFLGGNPAPVWTITADRVEETGRFDVDLTGLKTGQVSDDGKRVAVVVGTKVAVFELASGRPLGAWTPPPHFGGVRGVALSPDGSHLLTANGDGTVYVVGLP
jgi:WD40 repeat protein